METFQCISKSTYLIVQDETLSMKKLNVFVPVDKETYRIIREIFSYSLKETIFLSVFYFQEKLQKKISTL